MQAALAISAKSLEIAERMSQAPNQPEVIQDVTTPSIPEETMFTKFRDTISNITIPRVNIHFHKPVTFTKPE